MARLSRIMLLIRSKLSFTMKVHEFHDKLFVMKYMEGTSPVVSAADQKQVVFHDESARVS
jgi:hypothetical protein